MRRLNWLLLFIFLSVNVSAQNRPRVIRYVPLGDSYTFCEGVDYERSWPVMLCGDLEKKNIKFNLIDNPAHTGYTTVHLLENEIPVLAEAKADFVTLCIGVNDWIKGVDSTTFAERYNIILDSIQAHISKKNYIVIITIPDFSVTPRGNEFAAGRNVAKGISEFNTIIKIIAHQRQLKVVDIFSLSQKMLNTPELIGEDGLHPSADEYALWEELIFSVVYELLLEK